MSAHLMTMLRRGLGDDVLKLRYLMVDGCAVDHVARAATEEALKQFYERYEEVGTLDKEHLCNGVRSVVPCVRELSCFGHLVNLVAREALAHYRQRPFMQLRDSFARLFYSGGKPSAKKGKYLGKALEDLVCPYDTTTSECVEFFSQWCSLPEETPLTEAILQNHFSKLLKALEGLQRVCGLDLSDIK